MIANPNLLIPKKRRPCKFLKGLADKTGLSCSRVDLNQRVVILWIEAVTETLKVITKQQQHLEIVGDGLPVDILR